jgi:outer membrane biosynthesis protein TonB
MTASLPADVRGSDLAVAAMLTALVLGGSMFALAYARLEHQAELPVIDPGMGIPIAVRPVADLSSGGLGEAGGDGARRVVPLAWRRKLPREQPPAVLDSPWPPPTEPEPAADTRSVTPKPIEQPEHEVPITPTPPDDSTTGEADPLEETGETGETSTEETGADVEAQDDSQGEDGTGDEGGTEGGPEGETEGATEGEAEGGGSGTDPLLERAIAFYRARLVAWFSARFRVTGSGLSPAQLAKYRVRVQIDLGEDLRIVDYQILSSDHPAFDKAARSMLEKMRGEKLPPPPENYPGAVQHQLTVTFTCAEDTCD